MNVKFLITIFISLYIFVATGLVDVNPGLKMAGMTNNMTAKTSFSDIIMHNDSSLRGAAHRRLQIEDVDTGNRMSIGNASETLNQNTSETSVPVSFLSDRLKASNHSSVIEKLPEQMTDSYLSRVFDLSTPASASLARQRPQLQSSMLRRRLALTERLNATTSCAREQALIKALSPGSKIHDHVLERDSWHYHFDHEPTNITDGVKDCITRTAHQCIDRLFNETNPKNALHKLAECFCDKVPTIYNSTERDEIFRVSDFGELSKSCPISPLDTWKRRSYKWISFGHSPIFPRSDAGQCLYGLHLVFALYDRSQSKKADKKSFIEQSLELPRCVNGTDVAIRSNGVLGLGKFADRAIAAVVSALILLFVGINFYKKHAAWCRKQSTSTTAGDEEETSIKVGEVEMSAGDFETTL